LVPTILLGSAVYLANALLVAAALWFFFVRIFDIETTYLNIYTALAVALVGTLVLAVLIGVVGLPDNFFVRMVTALIAFTVVFRFALVTSGDLKPGFGHAMLAGALSLALFFLMFALERLAFPQIPSFF
jgi:hypothetical protein